MRGPSHGEIVPSPLWRGAFGWARPVLQPDPAEILPFVPLQEFVRRARAHRRQERELQRTERVLQRLDRDVAALIRLRFPFRIPACLARGPINRACGE